MKLRPSPIFQAINTINTGDKVNNNYDIPLFSTFFVTSYIIQIPSYRSSDSLTKLLIT